MAKKRKHAFWITARVMLRYRLQIVLGAFGVILSAASFGGGLAMLLPILHLLLQEKRDIGSVIAEYAPFLEPYITPYVSDSPLINFYGALVLVSAIIIIGSIGRYLHGIMSYTIAQRSCMVWREKLFDHLVRLPLLSGSGLGSSDQISRLVNDTGRLAIGYRAVISKALLETSQALVVLVGAFLINWQLALLAMAGAPVIGIMLGVFGRRIRKASKRVLETNSQMMGVADEALGHARVVKTHNAEGYERRRFRRISRWIYLSEMGMRQVRAMASPVNEAISLIGVVIAAGVAGFYVIDQNVPAEEFMTVMAMLIAAGSKIKPITNLHNEVKEAQAGADRILEMMDEPTEPVDVASRRVLPVLPRHTQSVEFDHVSFSYPNADKQAVAGVSLRVEHGERIAIVGGNGCGKTTLLSMLPRLIEPTQGRVLIDGIDIAEVNLVKLREQFGVVTQETVLFRGTIAENIAYGRRWLTQAQIEAAAEAAYADDFINALPKRYQHELGQDGLGLSGGQRQRLCIARAILRDPAILILDEATSQIDADSEEKINRAMREFSRGRTTFVIAHRLSTVVDADRIIVMDAGQILDQGKHAELIQRCEAYQILTQTQLLEPSRS